MASFADINDFMAGPWSADLAPTMTRFHRRYEVTATDGIVRVLLRERRVHVDPVLAEVLTMPSDLALWVVAARNLVLVRSFADPVSDPVLQWWQLAWTIAHAANSYNLPRESLGHMFPNTTLLGCVLSLRWSSIRALPIPSAGYISSIISKSAESYESWMDLGDLLYQNLVPPAMALPLLPDEGTGTVEEDDDGLGWVRIPDTTDPGVHWALTAVPTAERERVFPKIPVPKVLDNLSNLVNDIDVLVTKSKYGHIGRREVVRYALGIPVFTGIVKEPENDRQPWNVYMDVSGSMTAYASVAWGLLKSLPEGSKVFAFSGVVVSADPHSNRVQSDGNTNYAVVADHILEQDVHQVLIISDDTVPLKPSRVRELRDRFDITYVSVRAGVKPESTLSHAARNYIVLADT